MFGTTYDLVSPKTCKVHLVVTVALVFIAKFEAFRTGNGSPFRAGLRVLQQARRERGRIRQVTTGTSDHYWSDTTSSDTTAIKSSHDYTAADHTS